MEHRVVVTGMGAVSPLGLNIPTLWCGITEARSGIAPITLFDTSGLATNFAGEVKGFDATNYMDRKDARRLDRFVQFAVASSEEALSTSELSITPDNREEIGVFIGCGVGGIETAWTEFNVMREKGPNRISPFLVPTILTNMAAAMVSMRTGVQGPSMCITSACASGAHAIGEAIETIRRGWAKAMIAGGTEAPITPISIASFANAHALSTRNDDPSGASRPFDLNRDGFVLAEGSALLVLESLEFALERNAPILAEVVSYGACSDAYRMTQPSEGGEGAARSMCLALKHGNVSPSEVSYINAHGTSTRAGDIAETQAIKAVFGERAYNIPVSSSKSQFGHMQGAAGAIEAIISILAIQHNLLPPTINLHYQDPMCDLDYVPNTPRPGRVDIVMSNSFGFGGHNVSLIFQRFTK